MPLCQHWGDQDRRTVNLRPTCTTFGEIEIEIIGYIDIHMCIYMCIHIYAHTYIYLYGEGRGNE